MFKKFKIFIRKESGKTIKVLRRVGTHMRPQRTREVPNRLAGWELLSNDDDLIHFALPADAESMCHNEANKNKV